MYICQVYLFFCIVFVLTNNFFLSVLFCFFYHFSFFLFFPPFFFVHFFLIHVPKVKMLKKMTKQREDYLAETDKDLVGCSVMISYSRKGNLYVSFFFFFFFLMHIFLYFFLKTEFPCLVVCSFVSGNCYSSHIAFGSFYFILLILSAIGFSFFFFLLCTCLTHYFSLPHLFNFFFFSL